MRKKIIEEIIAKKKSDKDAAIKKSLEKAYNDFCDLIKICVPLAMSSFIFECVGTEKMKLIFEEYYNSQTYSSPEKLLLLMLLCDLKITGWENKLSDYIKNVRFAFSSIHKNLILFSANQVVQRTVKKIGKLNYIIYRRQALSVVPIINNLARKMRFFA